MRAEEISGLYWTPPARATIAEIHPLLIATFVSKTNYKDWSAYSANVFDMSSGGPVGYFEVVLDPDSNRACGYYSSVGSEPAIAPPIWFARSGDVDAVLRDFHRILREAGHVE
ncbi:hypothetical protein EFQ99_16460 [Rhizobium vallis]|uniref:Uncharacterized protein n=1 Tax=Rhizobium vallis TaxID=634290 RepID=A0A432PK20_9HYPH|nr:hypothetical protein EFQ99_16460 [Rhizobium vallis]